MSEALTQTKMVGIAIDAGSKTSYGSMQAFELYQKSKLRQTNGHYDGVFSYANRCETIEIPTLGKTQSLGIAILDIDMNGVKRMMAIHVLKVKASYDLPKKQTSCEDSE